MEKKFLFGNYLILWVILLFGQLNGCNSCIKKEKNALLELKTHVVSMGVEEETFNSVLPSWSNKTKSDCCLWEGVECSRTSGRVTEIAITEKLSFLKENSLLNLSLLHSFEELRSLNLSNEEYIGGFSGFFDDSEGYKSLRKLRNLEILDLSKNNFNSSIFPFVNAATSLKSLSLRNNKMEGSIPAKALKNLINLELLDLSGNMRNGSMADLTHLSKLKSLYLSDNYFSSSMELQALKNLINLELLDLSGNRLNGSMPDLTHLSKLKSLYLSHNYFSSSMELQVSALKNLINLELLDLSFNRLNGTMPDFTHLTKLKSLYLSDNDFSGSVECQGIKSLRRLKKLEILDLSENNFNSSIIFSFINEATSLKSLSLGYNLMEGSIPLGALKDLINLEHLDLSKNYLLDVSMADFTHLRKLKSLDLSSNHVSGSIESQALRYLTKLEVLNLEKNRLNGSMSVFCKMKNLRELNLNENKYVGQLPLCLGGLKELRVLDLSDNHFSGELPSSFSSLESIEYLSLLDNNFTGLMSLQLTNLTKLKVLKLSSTSDMVQVDVESILKPKFQLSVLVLRSCGLEKIPSFLIYQKRLRLVDLSNNKLSKIIPTWLLANNSELEVLTLQNNLFTIFQMPPILNHNLKFLDVSANHIGGLFPDNVGRVLPNMLHMIISRNRFQGSFSSSEMKKIQLMDLSYNNFSGKLPRSFLKDCFSLEYLFIKSNLFTGNIAVGLLSSTKLSVLDMSNNFLTGAIPGWLSNISLTYLDLSGNLLSGVLPSRVSNNTGGLRKAEVFLHDNKFIGPIPETFLENVEILDLRNNEFSGRIPHFVNTESIKILLLRGNNLTGSIPRQLCELSNIRLLDLSDNKFDGLIPSCLYNLSFGNREEEKMDYYDWGTIDYYYGVIIAYYYVQLEIYDWGTIDPETIVYYLPAIVIKFAAKQRYESYSGIYEFSNGTLSYMYGMDLSNNELSGIIPTELGNLSKLLVMNLSHNFLSSSIPSSFSNLNDIESLDLSYNKLHGRIPHQLTSLTSLAVFDVSYNNLSGIIPQGRQFNTFNEKSYVGNHFLCGQPTNRICEAKKNSEESDNGEEEVDDESYVDMLVFYYGAASTYMTLLIGICVFLCIDCPWRRAWFDIIDAFIVSVKGILF